MLNLLYNSHQGTSWKISTLKCYFLRQFTTIESRTLRWTCQHSLPASSLGTVSKIEIFDPYHYFLHSTFTAQAQVNNVLLWIPFWVPVSWKALLVSGFYHISTGDHKSQLFCCILETLVFILILSLFPSEDIFFISFRQFLPGIFSGDYNFFYVSWGLSSLVVERN